MKRMYILSLVALAFSLIGVTIAFAAGKLPYDKSKPPQAIQNLAAPAPIPAASRCDTKTATKGVLKTYSTAGYVGINYKVTDSAGAAIIAKRYLGSNTAYIPESGGSLVNGGGNTYNNITFGKYSTGAPPTAVTTCIERF